MMSYLGRIVLMPGDKEFGPKQWERAACSGGRKIKSSNDREKKEKRGMSNQCK